MTSSAGNAGAPAEPTGTLRRIAGALGYLVTTPRLRVLFACNCVLGMAISFVLPFMSLFGTLEVGMSLGVFGVFMTANALGSVAISTWLSRRSDSGVSRRSLLLLGSAAGALGYAGYAVVREPWLLFVIGAAVLGMASLTFVQLFAHARELVDGSDQRRADAPLLMNAFRMAFALSWTVGPAVAAFVLREFSFVGLFGAASVLFVLLFVLIFAFVGRTTPATTPPVTASAGPLRAALGRRDVLLWFSGLSLMLAAHQMSVNNMSLLVLKELGGEESQVGVIFSLAPVFELPFMLYVGLLATRIRSAKLIRASMVLAALYYVGLGCVRTPEQIYPLQAVSAAIVAVTSGVAITFFQDLIPNQLGGATNLYSNAARIGSTSGYLAFGLVASRFGHRGTALACAVLAATALVLTAFTGSRSNQDLG